MTVVDFALGALTAVYAMVGGAILNGAITNPANCSVLLTAVWKPLVLIFQASCFLPGTVGLFYLNDTDQLDGMVAPLIWFALANGSALAILYLARLIVRVLEGVPPAR